MSKVASRWFTYFLIALMNGLFLFLPLLYSIKHFFHLVDASSFIPASFFVLGALAWIPSLVKVLNRYLVKEGRFFIGFSLFSGVIYLILATMTTAIFFFLMYMVALLKLYPNYSVFKTLATALSMEAWHLGVYISLPEMSFFLSWWPVVGLVDGLIIRDFVIRRLASRWE